MKVRFPIKFKLLSLILIVAVPMAAMLLYHYFTITELAREDVRNHNQETAADVARYLDDFVDKSLTILQVLAKHPAVAGKDTAACNGVFAAILASYPEYLNIQATNMQGFNYGSGIHAPDIMKLNYRDTQWFSRARLGKPVVGNLTTSKFFRIPTVMIAVPVFDEAGMQTGILRVSLNLQRIRQLMYQKWRLPENSSIDILDAEGNIILCSIHDEAPCQEIFKTEAISSHIGTAETIEEKNTALREKGYLYSFSPLKRHSWKVAVSVPADAAYTKASFVNSRDAALLFLVSSLAIIISLVLSRKMTRNVELLSSGLREIEQGNMDYELKIAASDELHDLADAFNTMVRKRKKADERLRESESFLTSVLEGIGEGVIVLDKSYRIISANNGYCRQLKMEPGEIIGRHCYELSHQRSTPCHEDPAGCDCTVRKCFETGEHHRSIHTHYDSKGNPKYIETNAYPLKDATGMVISAIETLVDVSDLILLEQRLEEVKERYRKLYDDAPQMMHSVDGSGNIVICNQTEADTLEYAVEELIGKPLMEIIAPDSRALCMQKFETLKKTGSFEGETLLISKNGKKIRVQIKAKALYDEQGNFLMSDSVLQDITEKKSLEEQLMQSQKMEAIGQLAGGVAHDFNNILMAIMGFADILHMKMGAQNPYTLYINQIRLSAERAANLTRSLLAFSRKQIISTKPSDLNSIVISIEKLLRRVIGEDILLHCLLTEKPLTVEVDTGQIEQVLMNLAANARDAMPEGGTLTIRTDMGEIDSLFIETHRFGRLGSYALISVSDTGKGIEKELRNKIFEPFYTTKEVGKGTGLGLSIVYGIVKQHNGYITLSSSLEEGTTFVIYLPLITSADIPVESEETSGETMCRGHETVLIAEDESVIRDAIATALREHGYTVVTAGDGEEAIDKFLDQPEKVSLFITDVIMPKKNGRDAFREMQEVRQDMKALYISGYPADIIQKKGKLGRDIHYIQKPVRLRDLLRKIREVLDIS